MRVLYIFLAAGTALALLNGCVTTATPESGSAAPSTTAPSSGARSPVDDKKYNESMALGRKLQDERRDAEAFDAFLAAAEARPGDPEALAGATFLARSLGKLEPFTESLKKQLPFAGEVARHTIYCAQVHVYWYFQKFDELEEARQRLIAYWRASSNPAIKSQSTFLRAIVRDETRGIIQVSEMYELKPPRAVRYVFQYHKRGSQRGDVVSLGTYDNTTQVMREIERRPPDWRMWHLDFYSNTGQGFRHETLGMFPNGEPSLRQIFDKAIERLKRQP